MILPAMGIISEVIPVFSRKPIFGYKAVAFSTVGDRVRLDARLGAPHVHGRAAERTCTRSSCSASMVDRHPDRREDLQLARDDSGAATSSSTRRCCSRSASSRCSRSAACPGSSSPPSRSTGSCTTRTSSSRTCTTCSSAASIFGIFAGALLLVAEDLRADARRAPRARSTFWLLLHRLQPHVLPAAHARAAWACRGGSTRTARAGSASGTT